MEYLVRTDDAGISYGGFRWAPLGEWTEAPDWDPAPRCGGGLHGQHPSASGYRGGGSRVVLAEIDGPLVTIGVDKIKVRRARIVAVDDLSAAPAHWPGNLDLAGCTALRALPKGLKVGSHLDLRGCSALQALPEGLTVGSSLSLLGCSALRALPKGLTVGSTLDLRGCSALRALPKDLKVEGEIYGRP